MARSWAAVAAFRLARRAAPRPLVASASRRLGEARLGRRRARLRRPLRALPPGARPAGRPSRSAGSTHARRWPRPGRCAQRHQRVAARRCRDVAGIRGLRLDLRAAATAPRCARPARAASTAADRERPRASSSVSARLSASRSRPVGGWPASAARSARRPARWPWPAGRRPSRSRRARPSACAARAFWHRAVRCGNGLVRGGQLRGVRRGGQGRARSGRRPGRRRRPPDAAAAPPPVGDGGVAPGRRGPSSRGGRSPRHRLAGWVRSAAAASPCARSRAAPRRCWPRPARRPAAAARSNGPRGGCGREWQPWQRFPRSCAAASRVGGRRQRRGGRRTFDRSSSARPAGKHHGVEQPDLRRQVLDLGAEVADRRPGATSRADAGLLQSTADRGAGLRDRAGSAGRPPRVDIGVGRGDRADTAALLGVVPPRLIQRPPIRGGGQRGPGHRDRPARAAASASFADCNAACCGGDGVVQFGDAVRHGDRRPAGARSVRCGPGRPARTPATAGRGPQPRHRQTDRSRSAPAAPTPVARQGLPHPRWRRPSR